MSNDNKILKFNDVEDSVADEFVECLPRKIDEISPLENQMVLLLFHASDDKGFMNPAYFFKGEYYWYPDVNFPEKVDLKEHKIEEWIPVYAEGHALQPIFKKHFDKKCGFTSIR